MNKFWIIMRDHSPTLSVMRYESQEEAVKEALLLAKESPLTTLYIMESVGVAETPKAVYTSYDAQGAPLR